MHLVLASVILAGVVWWTGQRITTALTAASAQRSRSRQLALLELFAPALAAAEREPQSLLVWQGLARTARQLFPDEFAALDRACGATFPFSTDLVQAAHARWTADWLAWERMHDADYKLKAAIVEEELKTSGGLPIVRARLDAVEREKLDLYQRRYADYVRVAKALQGLI